MWYPGRMIFIGAGQKDVYSNSSTINGVIQAFIKMLRFNIEEIRE